MAARHIIEALADGLDPATGELLERGSPMESPDVIRALHIALSSIDRQIRRQNHEAESPSNAGKSWSDQDDLALGKAFDDGQSVAAIAKRMERTEGSIASRLLRIGKVTDRDAALRRTARGE